MYRITTSNEQSQHVTIRYRHSFSTTSRRFHQPSPPARAQQLTALPARNEADEVEYSGMIMFMILPRNQSEITVVSQGVKLLAFKNWTNHYKPCDRIVHTRRATASAPWEMGLGSAMPELCLSPCSSAQFIIQHLKDSYFGCHTMSPCLASQHGVLAGGGRFPAFPGIFTSSTSFLIGQLEDKLRDCGKHCQREELSMGSINKQL